MPYFSIYVIIFFFYQQNGFAQTPTIEWQRCLGGTTSDVSYKPFLRSTSDGGSILLSSTSSTDGDVVGNHGGGDIWVIKLSNTSTIQWQRCLGGSSIDIADNPSIQQTADGGYILTGSTSSLDGDVTGNHGGIDSWVVKLSSTGTIQWQRCLGGSSYDYSSSILPTADGGYLLTGYTASFDGDVVGNHGGSDLWAVKLNSTGVIQWQRCLGGSGYEVANNGYDYASTIQLTPDGGYLFSGYTASTNGDVTGNHGGGDIWVVKLSSAGVIQWQRCLGGSGYDYTAFIRLTTDGGFILSGYTYSIDGNVTGNHGGGDIWVVRLSSTGTVLWQRCLGGSGLDIIDNPSIQPTADGGCIFAGITASLDGDVVGNHGGSDIWVVKLGSAGTIQWQHCLGGSLDEHSSSITPTTDGGYLLAGNTASLDGDVVGNHGSSDLWVVKLNSSGGLQWQRCFGGSLDELNTSIQQSTDGSYILAGSTVSSDGDVTGKHGDSDLWVVKLGISIQHFHQISQSISLKTRQLLTENANFKVCADGSDASIFNVSGGGKDFSQAVIKLLGVSSQMGSFSVIQQSRDSLSVRYKHPDYISTPGTSTTIAVSLYATSTSTAAMTTFTMTVYRAPVLLVHGMWSGPESFSAMEGQLISANLYTSSLVKRVDYSATAGKHFSENVPVLAKAIEDLIRAVRDLGIAAGKVDYVAHSTGGLIGRLHLQTAGYANTIRRLITLNTPHSGSQLGNLMRDPAVKKALDIACLTVFPVAFPAMLCGAGAVDDLRVDGTVVLQDLNGANLNARSVPAHSIATTASSPTVSYGFNKQNKSAVFDFFLTADPFTTFNGNNDGLVPESSQYGGLQGDCTTLIGGQMHIGSPANKQVIDRVKVLLATTPVSTSFCQYFNPVKLLYLASTVNSPDQVVAPPGSISIVAPVRGKSVSANTLVTITIVGKELTEIRTMVDFNRDSVYLAQKNDAQVTYRVLSDGRSPGKKYITAIGKTTAGSYIADTTFFYVDASLAESQCNSLQSGNWSSASTWSCGHEPTGKDIVMINPGHIITVTTNTAQAQLIYNLSTIRYTIVGAKVSVKGSD